MITQTIEVNGNIINLYFDSKSNWVSGNVNGIKFSAKVFDIGSMFGIDNGRVSKLQIENVCNYDRGWDIEPSEGNVDIYNLVMYALNQIPARFS